MIICIDYLHTIPVYHKFSKDAVCFANLRISLVCCVTIRWLYRRDARGGGRCERRAVVLLCVLLIFNFLKGGGCRRRRMYYYLNKRIINKIIGKVGRVFIMPNKKTNKTSKFKLHVLFCFTF